MSQSSAKSPAGPFTGALSDDPPDPCGSVSCVVVVDSSLGRSPHYLASIIVTNTKYSVNKQFSPVQIPPLPPRPDTIGRRPESAPPEAELPANTHKSGKKAGPRISRPRPLHERMTYKSRLGITRQALVCVRCVTPTYCVPAMWILGMTGPERRHPGMTRGRIPSAWRVQRYSAVRRFSIPIDQVWQRHWQSNRSAKSGWPVMEQVQSGPSSYPA